MVKAYATYAMNQRKIICTTAKCTNKKHTKHLNSYNIILYHMKKFHIKKKVSKHAKKKKSTKHKLTRKRTVQRPRIGLCQRKGETMSGCDIIEGLDFQKNGTVAREIEWALIKKELRIETIY